MADRDYLELTAPGVGDREVSPPAFPAGAAPSPPGDPTDLVLKDGTRVRNGRPLGVRNGEGTAEKYQPKRLAGDHLVMLEMHMAGFTNKEIAAELDCTPQTVSNHVTSDLGLEFIRERTNAMNAEFHGLFRKVINTVSDAMEPSVDLAIRLQGADKWLKAHGRYAPKKDGEDRLTAEDIVQKLLARQGGDIHIHDSQVVVQTGKKDEAA